MNLIVYHRRHTSIILLEQAVHYRHRLLWKALSNDQKRRGCIVTNKLGLPLRSSHPTNVTNATAQTITVCTY